MEKHIALLQASGFNDVASVEDHSLELAVEETYQNTGKRWRPWAKNARSLRVGDIVLIVDADTNVPEVSNPTRRATGSQLTYSSPRLHTPRRTAFGMPLVKWLNAQKSPSSSTNQASAQPSVASGVLTVRGTDVMQIAHHFFENGLAYFTRRMNKCISLACANGEMAPFVGHNAFLRWSAIQDAAFVDPIDGTKKIWSDTCVSEDFDLALRVQAQGIYNPLGQLF